MSWLIPCIVTLMFWGFWGFFMKAASAYFDWHQLVIVSSLVSVTASMLIYLYIRPQFDVSSPGLRYALLASALGTIALVSFYVAIQTGRASIVVPLTSLYPVITIVLSHFFLHERITMYQGLGVALAIIALILVSIE
ncbi:MAG: EamA family transporter [Nitrososphaeria archaeon]|nr:EamA family transporter [Nitrososphaeria archaeon]NIN52950.1 EamA family transporter [Nitrososphaeria archaeon]NIQ33509.1 EamA family transporter [Nitrososphaeria archaeon]